MNPNYIKFRDTLEKHYIDLFQNDLAYSYSADTSADVLADKMTKGLYNGTALKDGKGIERTCRDLGINYTYKDIVKFLHKNEG